MESTTKSLLLRIDLQDDPADRQCTLYMPNNLFSEGIHLDSRLSDYLSVASQIYHVMQVKITMYVLRTEYSVLLVLRSNWVMVVVVNI